MNGECCTSWRSFASALGASFVWELLCAGSCATCAATSGIPLTVGSSPALVFFSFRFFFFSARPSSRASSTRESCAASLSRRCFFALFSRSLSRFRFFSFFSEGAIVVGDTGVGGASIEVFACRQCAAVSETGLDMKKRGSCRSKNPSSGGPSFCRVALAFASSGMEALPFHLAHLCTSQRDAVILRTIAQHRSRSTTKQLSSHRYPPTHPALGWRELGGASGEVGLHQVLMYFCTAATSYIFPRSPHVLAQP